LDEICDILLTIKDPQTPAGIVRKAGRAGMSYTITTLAELAAQDVDMQSTVIIGNSRTFVKNGRMITPRGYEL
ncbi:MAG: cobalt-precorrin-3B C(17)-methyltransferase, partial [Negativicoccus succinicivorans]|nr:cobalt-precorrin-3B C(17)-methyltransferase [Negativicoccus succinicivorans]